MAYQPKRKRRIGDLNVTKMAFVEAGANGRNILLYKSAESDDDEDEESYVPAELKKHAPVEEAEETVSYDEQAVNEMLAKIAR